MTLSALHTSAEESLPSDAPPAAEPPGTALLEYCDWNGTTPRIDRPSGMLQGVKILGTRSLNGRVYLSEALQQAVGLYEGAKVNINHPKGNPRAPRDYQERLGSIHNVTLREGQGLFGDLHYNPRHALAEQLLWDAAHAPQNVGFSHNVMARLARRDEQWVVEAITRVNSVDLVADPATTGGLFEAAGTLGAPADADPGQLAALTCESLRQHRPDLIEALLLEERTERRRLENENERLKRRALIAAVLGEFQLPLPESPDPVARAITSDPFVESLLSAADEHQVRQLVEERSALISGVRQGAFGGTATRPVSRPPRTAGLSPSLDTKSFVRAIRG